VVKLLNVQYRRPQPLNTFNTRVTSVELIYRRFHRYDYVQNSGLLDIARLVING